jgi:ACS family hexuronate transporter-like MFS transporter
MDALKKHNFKWRIGILLCFASALNYIDRNTLAILAPTIQQELHWTDIDYGNITALFVFSYTIMYAISGRIIDSIGTKKGFTWSLVSALHALSTTVGHFSIARFFLGITESANFPAGIKSITEWFPVKERALAVGLFSAGSAIGATIAVPLVSFIALEWGWRMAFVVTGLLGFIWLIFWLKYYYTPSQLPSSATAENALKQNETIHPIEIESTSSVSIKKILTTKQSWGCFAGRIFIDPVVYFFIFWIPKYLHDVQGLPLSEIGGKAWLPYAAMGIGTILGGYIPKRLIEKKNWTLNRSRKTVMLIASICIPVFCYVLTCNIGSFTAILLMSGIMLSHGLWSNITLPTEVYPKHIQATVTGIGGTLGGLMSVVTQKMIGATVASYSYLPIFIFIGSAYLLAFLMVHFLIGTIGKMHSFQPN